MSQADEYHIASFVAQCEPSEIERLKELIDSFVDAEVHGENEQGKIVFTVEGTSQKSIANIVDQRTNIEMGSCLKLLF